jgi:hypothetical protein
MHLVPSFSSLTILFLILVDSDCTNVNDGFVTKTEFESKRNSRHEIVEERDNQERSLKETEIKKMGKLQKRVFLLLIFLKVKFNLRRVTNLMKQNLLCRRV